MGASRTNRNAASAWQLLMLLLIALCLLVRPVKCTSADDLVEARRGLVVSVSEPASRAGLEVLKRGGNAVDAAVATAFALAVTYPQAGNIGGGGFMMVFPVDGRPPMCVEYRETAPAAANRDTFRHQESHLGAKIVGTPGTVRGLALAHQHYGKLRWEELVAPAVRLAQDGFVLDEAVADSLNDVLSDSLEFDELQRVYRKADGATWKAGDRLRLPDLARTLQVIAQGGAESFYRGVIAERIVAEMQRDGGLITLADLANYDAKLRPPIHGTFRGCDVYGPPPPSSGGICLVQMLNVLENFDLTNHGRDSPETIHLMVEAMRRAYCDRARWLGDPDFVTIPEKLIMKDYAKQLADSIDPNHATSSEALANDIPLADESPSTTHFSVIDADGMAVSNTYTLEQSYGSRVVVKGAGFLLNNEMGDFNWRPGHTDRSGRIGTEPNLVAPRKRMLSSQTPVIVSRDGKVFLITGSPGGRTIINTLLCVLINVLEFEMDPRSAVDAPRLHHGWFPDRISMEATEGEHSREVIARLSAMGHTVQPAPRPQGDAHTIWVDPQTGHYFGAADRRISGNAVGY